MNVYVTPDAGTESQTASAAKKQSKSRKSKSKTSTLHDGTAQDSNNVDSLDEITHTITKIEKTVIEVIAPAITSKPKALPESAPKPKTTSQKKWWVGWDVFGPAETAQVTTSKKQVPSKSVPKPGKNTAASKQKKWWVNSDAFGPADEPRAQKEPRPSERQRWVDWIFPPPQTVYVTTTVESKSGAATESEEESILPDVATEQVVIETESAEESAETDATTEQVVTETESAEESAETDATTEEIDSTLR